GGGVDLVQEVPFPHHVTFLEGSGKNESGCAGTNVDRLETVEPSGEILVVGDLIRDWERHDHVYGFLVGGLRSAGVAPAKYDAGQEPQAAAKPYPAPRVLDRPERGSCIQQSSTPVSVPQKTARNVRSRSDERTCSTLVVRRLAGLGSLAWFRRFG